MLYGTDPLTIQGHFPPTAGRIKDNTHTKQPIRYHFSQKCHRHPEFNMPPKSAPRLGFISWLYYWHHNPSTKAQKLKTWVLFPNPLFPHSPSTVRSFSFSKGIKFQIFSCIPTSTTLIQNLKFPYLHESLLIDHPASTPLVPQWLIFTLPAKWAL